jgi:hypothetical protein
MLTSLMLQAPKKAVDVVDIFGWHFCYAGVRAFAVNPAVPMLLLQLVASLLLILFLASLWLLDSSLLLASRN